MAKIDLRILSIVTLMKKAEKKILTNETKEEIRKGEYTTIGNTYGKIKPKDYTSTKYIDKEGNEISQSEIIKNYCEEKGIEIVKETKENYSIEIIPSEKAEQVFNKMITTLEEDQDDKIMAKVASILKDRIQ